MRKPCPPRAARTRTAISPAGREDARALGEWMERRASKPDLILCSDARRTRETCEAMQEPFDHKIGTIYSKNLYDAARADLLEILQNADDTVSSLMLIGHNPAIYELCMLLAPDGPPALLSRLDRGYPPATLSVFEADVASWGDLDPDRCKLTDLCGPQDYNSPSPSRWN
jgi:phosphohistidine phosphatase